MHIDRFQTPNLCISCKFQQNSQQAHRGPVVREPATRIARGNAPDSKSKAPEQRRWTRALGLEPRDRTRGVRATAVSSQKEPGPKECQDPRAPDPRAATVPTPKAGAAIATAATDPRGRGGEPTRRVMQSRRTQWQPASPRIQSQGAPKPPLFRTGTAPDSHLLPTFHNAYMNR